MRVAVVERLLPSREDLRDTEAFREGVSAFTLRHEHKSATVVADIQEMPVSENRRLPATTEEKSVNSSIASFTADDDAVAYEYLAG